MKTKWLVGCILLAGAMILRAQTNDLSAVLQKGLFEEEANRNLDAAISNYQSLAAQFDQDRQVAATAIFRLGECYRKLGRTNDAVAQYQRIVREFPDQQTLTTLSRQNLAGLGSQPATTPAVSTAARQEQKRLLEEEIKLAEVQRESIKQQIEHGRAGPDDLVSKEREILELRRQLATLDTGVDESPGGAGDKAARQEQKRLLAAEIKLVEERRETVKKQFELGTVSRDDLVAKEREILGLRRQLAALETGADESPGTAGTQTAAVVIDEEEQEIRRIQAMIQNSPDLINAQSGEDLLTPLCRAAKGGQMRVAAFLLANGVDINFKANGRAPLHFAAAAGQKAMVELLLDHHAAVDTRDNAGWTPLYEVAARGYKAVAETLLAHHANVNAQANDGRSPLQNAADCGQPEVVKLLLANGADVNTTDNKGRTPLTSAASNFQNEAIVKALLDAKADPNGGKLDAPLLVAINKKDAASAALLLANGASPNAKGTIDWSVVYGGRTYFEKTYPQPSVTPLWLAVDMKQLPMVQLLLKFKADPNDSQTDGQPLLFSALSDINILEALLDAGADPNQADANGTPPLMKLYSFSESSERNVTFAKQLVAHGAKINVPDKQGTTPLDVAVVRGDHELTKLLLANKADVNARRPSDGATVLHLAVQSGNRELIELILANKADVNARDNAGETPLDWAKKRMTGSASSEQIALFDKLAGLLRQHGALDNLPDWDCIGVSRPSAKFSFTIFRKGTNDWNRFTLLETILNYYESSKTYSVPAGNNTWNNYPANAMMPFPNLTRVVIVRHTHGITNETRIKVNLLNNTNDIDCSKDLPLEFGDVVEIPEREHTLRDQPIGLTRSQSDTILNSLKGSVRLVVHGTQVELPVYPTDSSLIGSVLNRPEARGILLSSSDLSRVKVTRRDPATGKKREWVINCSPSPEAAPAGSSFSQRLQAIMERSRDDGQFGGVPDLWLRNGDVIEVPEK